MARLDEIGRRDGDEAEEEEDKEVAEAVVAEGPGSPGVGGPADDAREADREHPRASPVDEPEAEDEGGEKDAGHRPAHRVRCHEARGHGPTRPDAGLRVGAFDEVIVVVREIGAHLDEEGETQAERRGRRVKAVVVGGQGGPHVDGRHGRRQRPRPAGCDPDRARRAGGAGVGGPAHLMENPENCGVRRLAQPVDLPHVPVHLLAHRRYERRHLARRALGLKVHPSVGKIGHKSGHLELPCGLERRIPETHALDPAR